MMLLLIATLLVDAEKSKRTKGKLENETNATRVSLGPDPMGRPSTTAAANSLTICHPVEFNKLLESKTNTTSTWQFGYDAVVVVVSAVED
jgi:hypothetical protein